MYREAIQSRIALASGDMNASTCLMVSSVYPCASIGARPCFCRHIRDMCIACPWESMISLPTVLPLILVNVISFFGRFSRMLASSATRISAFSASVYRSAISGAFPARMFSAVLTGIVSRDFFILSVIVTPDFSTGSTMSS